MIFTSSTVYTRDDLVQILPLLQIFCGMVNKNKEYIFFFFLNVELFMIFI